MPSRALQFEDHCIVGTSLYTIMYLFVKQGDFLAMLTPIDPFNNTFIEILIFRISKYVYLKTIFSTSNISYTA